MDVDCVVNDLRSAEGHNALEVQLVVDSSSFAEMSRAKSRARSLLQERRGIGHSTIEIERPEEWRYGGAGLLGHEVGSAAFGGGRTLADGADRHVLAALDANPAAGVRRRLPLHVDVGSLAPGPDFAIQIVEDEISVSGAYR